MAANTAPIYSVAGDLQHNTALMATAASVVYDCSGTIGTDIYLLYTAPANGGFVQANQPIGNKLVLGIVLRFIAIASLAQLLAVQAAYLLAA